MRNHLQVSRRKFLKTSLATSAGLAAGGMLPGLAPQAAPVVTMNFKGWDYEPDLVRENLNIFEKLHPDIKVNYEAMGGAYNDKMAAIFVAKTPLDCCYVRDTDSGAWVAAGWLRDLEGLPGVEDYKKIINAGNLEAMTFDGKLYGLPYYTGFLAWAYRSDILEKAGFDTPGKTFDEVHERCMKIKEKGLIQFPIIYGFKSFTGGNMGWWAMNYASGIRWFDDDNNPIMHEDPRCEKILQWFVDAVHKYKYMDLKSLELSQDDVAFTALAGGTTGYGATVPKFALQRINDPKLSKVPGKVNIMPYPSLDGTTAGTVSWTRMYSLTSHVEEERIASAWKLIQYLGGKDKDGQLFTAKRWYLAKGLGFAYPELWDDKDIVESTSAWADVNVIKEIGKTARPIEIVREPWFGEFHRILHPNLQRAITKEVTAKQALVELAKQAKKIKKDWFA